MAMYGIYGIYGSRSKCENVSKIVIKVLQGSAVTQTDQLTVVWPDYVGLYVLILYGK